MKRLYFAWCFLLISSLLFSSCKKNKAEDTPDNEKPDTEEPGTENPAGKKEVAIWIDLRSNVFSATGQFRDTSLIKSTLDTLKDVGVTTLIADCKASSGFTVYPSVYTRQLTSMDGNTFTPGVDYLDFMIKQARKRNMKIYASTMVFVEGDNARKLGNVFDDANFKDTYQTIVCDINGNRIPITQSGRNGFVNPAIPQVQERAINIMKELAQKYDLDGIITDYCRYADINADFSDFSKNEFIKFLEQQYSDSNAKYMDFPKAVVASWKLNSDQIIPATTGSYYKKWLVYRAKVMHDFVQRAKQEVKKIKPNITFGSYVGSWYATYYQVGVNWASNTYDPFADSNIRFDWAYPEYKNYGLAEELDLLMTGNYSSQIMINDNPATVGMTYHWWSIEGSVNAGKYVTKGKVPLYGSIDMGNISYSSKSDISKAIKLILSKSNGVMLFDVVHAYSPRYNRLGVKLWDEIKEGTKDYRSN